MSRYPLPTLLVATLFVAATSAANATLRHRPAPTFVTTAPLVRALLTTELRDGTPSITLRGSQLSIVATSILPFESAGYYQTIGGFYLSSVTAVAGTSYDLASCTVSYNHALCTDTTLGSNAAIDILGDAASNYPGNYRTFKLSYQSRDPRANGYIYNPLRTLALAVVFSDNDVPQHLFQQYVYWTPQP